MKMVRSAAVLGVALSAALLCTAAWGASGQGQAAATDQTFLDPRGDVPLSIDVLQVRVVNDRARPVVVVVEQERLEAGDGVIIWLDTAPSRPGPEYFAGGIANSDVLGIVSVDSWTDRGTWVQCEGFRLRAGQEQPGDRVVLQVPRGCVGDPAAVGVSVLTFRNGPQGQVGDYAPRRHAFYPLVPR